MPKEQTAAAEPRMTPDELTEFLQQSRAWPDLGEDIPDGVDGEASRTCGSSLRLISVARATAPT
jgi:hypothetical protein